MELADALGLGTEEVVAFVGAGGKKTAMGRLVAAGRTRAPRVGYTTTTHMPPPSDIDLSLEPPSALPEGLSEALPEDLSEALPENLPTPSEPVAIAAERVPNPDRADEKVRGYDPAVVDRLAESGHFDWLLVKADGARRREFKAPGPDEPQLPSSATVVVPVASVAAVGAPLDDGAVHRPERVAALTGREPGKSLTVEDVARVLASPEGGLKDVPPSATVVPVVNKADTPGERATARAVIERALEATDRFDRGLATSLRLDELETVRR